MRRRINKGAGGTRERRKGQSGPGESASRCVKSLAQERGAGRQGSEGGRGGGAREKEKGRREAGEGERRRAAEGCGSERAGESAGMERGRGEVAVCGRRRRGAPCRAAVGQPDAARAHSYPPAWPGAAAGHSVGVQSAQLVDLQGRRWGGVP